MVWVLYRIAENWIQSLRDVKPLSHVVRLGFYGLRGGGVVGPRHSGVVVGVGAHRVRVGRQSPISTKHFSQNELVN